jgi:class 3 adenylate cyclase
MHGGHEVKSLGDGLMLVFSSPTDAVNCAVAIQNAILQGNVEEPVAVRIGVHTGEPVFENRDYYGLSVVIAKRLCDAAQAGSILVSDVVRTLTSRTLPIENRVELKLKGLADATVAWQVTIQQ